MNDIDYGPREADDAAAADLAKERYEDCVAAIHDAAMWGVPQEIINTLCRECGVRPEDVQAYDPRDNRRAA